MQLRGREAGSPAQDIVGLGDELHVAIFDAVVDHLHVVARAARSHVGDARLAIGRFGGDGGEDRLDEGVGLGTAAGHDAGAMERALLAAGNAGADVEQARGLQVPGAALGVGEEAVAAVDEQVAGRQVRSELGDDLVDRRARPLP